MNQIAKPADAPPLSRNEVLSILAGLLTALFLAALDQTIVATALPTIGRQLGGIDQLPWVVTSYLLVSTIVTPLYGKLSDIHGRRVMLLLAVAIFLVGSVACALAPTMLVLILARGLQGLGGGGIQSTVMTVIGDIVPPRERGHYQVYMASVWTTSSLAGPVLGGFLAQNLSWTVIFWINVPIGLVALFLSNAKLKTIPRHERPHKLDFIGALLVIAFSLPLLLALSTGGTHYSWSSTPIRLLFGASALFAILLVFRLRTAEEPLIPLKVMSNAIVLFGTASLFFSMGVFIALTIYLPVYLQGVLGMSAANSGLALVPLALATVVGASVAGRLLSTAKHYKRIPLIGLSVSLLGTLALFAVPTGLPLALRECLFFVVGLGLGTVMPTVTVSVQNAVALHDLGAATGLVNFVRQLGAALAVAVFGTVIIGAGMRGFAGSAEPALALAAVAASFKVAFLIAAGGLVVSLAFLAAMEERPLLGHRDRAAQKVATFELD